MSLTVPEITKCHRDGCQTLTPNTFCSCECRRLANIGRPTPKRQTKCGHGCGDADYGEGMRITTAEMATINAKVKALEGERDSSGRRRWLSAHKRRREAEARRKTARGRRWSP